MRGWVNLGISSHNLGNYNEAASYYLCALSLNPDADHVWNYLQTSLVAIGTAFE